MHKQYNITSSAPKWVYVGTTIYQHLMRKYTFSHWVGFSLFFTSIYVRWIHWFVGYIHLYVRQYACIQNISNMPVGTLFSFERNITMFDIFYIQFYCRLAECIIWLDSWRGVVLCKRWEPANRNIVYFCNTSLCRHDQV